MVDSKSSKSQSILTVRDVEEIKMQIKYLISFDHPENRYFNSTESKVAKLMMSTRKTCAEEYNRVKRLEDDLFS